MRLFSGAPNMRGNFIRTAVKVVITFNLVRTYSEWVIDGEYDWPPKCSQCQAELEEGTGSQTTRLGCLHVIHTNCLVSHVKSFPSHTAPAGYVCPACSTPLWPPKIVKDSGSRLHSLLKEAIVQTGVEKNLFGNHPVSLVATESRGPPPAFASDPLIAVSSTGGTENNARPLLLQDEISVAEGYSAATGAGSSRDILEIDGPSTAGNFVKTSSPPGATTRKGAFQVERQSSEISYYADDEDGNRKKYTRRGPLQHKFLRALLPFWSSALPTLPVTAPARKDALNANDVSEGRVRHQRSSRMDPRKVLLIIALMACMATMGILYYRLVQRGFSGELPEEEQQ
ncbi:hypothetical protein CJ030_MR7G001348 [Morella rubra]|uniref:RING-type domain-containing protein n=1 Tax=Morella rubra TaxID=262757 RepID=A0A6A1V6C4_9ROSI|nr:hypothetical protein CJ030_MR7G001348 [Morella rubra]